MTEKLFTGTLNHNQKTKTNRAVYIATEGSQRVEISDLGRREAVLSMQQKQRH